MHLPTNDPLVRDHCLFCWISWGFLPHIITCSLVEDHAFSAGSLRAFFCTSSPIRFSLTAMGGLFSDLAACLRSAESVVTSCGSLLGPLVEPVQGVACFDKEWEKLCKEKENLDVDWDCLRSRISTGEQPRRCLPDVEKWRRQFHELTDKVCQLRVELGGGQPRPLWSRFLLSRRVAALRVTVAELTRKNNFEAVFSEVPGDGPDPPNHNRGSSKLSIDGNEETLTEILNHLGKNEVEILSICGTGGIGKTRILDRVCYESLTTGGFTDIIWADMDRKMDMRELQDDIFRHFGRTNSGRENLLKLLSNCQSFLLLVDNVWGELDLDKIGIPTPAPENRLKLKGFKIVLTTRLKSVSVCTNMGDLHSRLIEVNFLDADRSLNLFRVNVNNEAIFVPESPFESHIKDVVSECGGLPLALKVVGRAMVGVRNEVEDWKDAADTLKDSPKDIRQVEKEVFQVLKFSFDHLSHQLQQCFLYCALFPEGHEIDQEQLVGYWIGEGLIEIEENDIQKSYRQGRDVIRQLLASCLLRRCRDEGKVKMHDVIRDMSLWIAGRTFSVPSGWKEQSGSFNNAKRISLIQTIVDKLPEKPRKCNELLTLLLNQSSIPPVPKEFFLYMSALRVLDLSDTTVEELPRAIGKLSSLQYLNLSNTPIRSLPKEVGCLIELRQLNLRSTSSLTSIPYNAVSGLLKLWQINMFHSAYDLFAVNNGTWCFHEKGVNFKTLEMFKLREVGINVKKLHDRHMFLASRLFKYTTSLCVEGFENLTGNSLSQVLQLRSLQELHVGHCNASAELSFYFKDLSQLKILKLINLPQVCITWTMLETKNYNIRCLEISGCHRLENISWVRYLFCLEVISLCDCNELREVIDGSGVVDATYPVSFERLKNITLGGLPNLTSICTFPAMFNSLESLTIDECPELTHLPLDDDNCSKIKVINGHSDWWQTVEWEPTINQTRFHSVFRNQSSGAWRENNQRCS